MTLIELHSRLGNTALFYTIIMALWGLWRFFRRQGVESNYWGALVIAEVLYLVQAGVGVYLWVSGAGQLVSMHLLYGIVSVLTVPAAFLYTRGGEQRRTMLIYGVSFLFLVGILLRSRATGG